MIRLKSDEEIALIAESSNLVSKTLAEVASFLRPGLTTAAVDEVAWHFIHDHRGVPAFKGYRGFPGSVCISINQEVVHGIPGERTIRDGDIVSVDCGVVMNGYYGDSAFTFAIGNVEEKTMRLLRVTRECLEMGTRAARSGNRIGDISHAVQQCAEANGYSVVRELVGHGLGRLLHEDPEVPNYGRKGKGPLIKDGLVIAIEPMINMGKRAVLQSEDGWTITAADGLPSAHFEYTLAVKGGKSIILSPFTEIDNAVKNNAEMREIAVKS